VDIKAREAGLARHAETGSDGHFAFGGLPSDLYDLSLTAAGYKSVVLKGLRLPLDGFAELEAAMESGQRSETIVVNAVEVARRMSPQDSRWALLQGECDAGQTQSCRDLGDVHVTARRRGLAVTAYEQACDQKDGLGCLALAYLPISPDEYEKRALPLLEHSCTDGQQEACVALTGMLKDEARAATLRAKACDLGNGEACLAVATHTQDDEVKRATFLARALDLLKEGCDRGRGRQCLWAAMLLMLREKGPALDPHATEALRKACELGQKDACDELPTRTQ
jgi:TPR repeat protein